jgi:glucoamylase
MTTVETLDGWVERQWERAARQMRRSISPLGIVKTRPGFDQVIHPARGAVVASPVPASYDPDPDYFFHWYRDSAIVIDALRLVHGAGERRSAEPPATVSGTAAEALGLFGEFVRFSAGLSQLDGGRVRAVSSP